MAIGYPKPAGTRQYRDDSGVPLAGGLVYAYATGLTTLKDTYTTASLDVPNSNPVVLDAAGRATMFMVPGEGYDFVVQDVFGVTIYSETNIQVPGSADLTDIVAGGLSIADQSANALIKATSTTQLGIVPPATDSVLVTNATGVPQFVQAARSLVTNSPTAVTGTSSTSEQDLQTVTIPADTLAVNGWAVRILAHGTFAANGQNKRVRAYFGTTVVADSGVVATNDKPWCVDVTVVRLSATTQSAFGWIAFDGGTGRIMWFADPTATCANTIPVKTTGLGETTGADITSLALVVEVLRGTM